MFMVEKKSLTEYSYSVKDGKSKSFPRCHLDSRVHSHALCKILTYLRQLTYAHTSQSTRILKSFDCALSGPFGNLHLDPALSFPDSLCAHNYFDLRFIGLKRYSICQEFITLKRQCQCTILIFFEIVEKFSQFSCLYFLFLFHANPPTPAPSEENASPNKPRTFAGSPVFAAFDPLVPLEADPSVVVPAFFVTVGVALPF